jgi:hypothetical protein
VIKDVRPVLQGPPDELWAALKAELTRSQLDPFLANLLDHGNIISCGPTEVEIGFHNSLYKDEFERRIAEKDAVRKLISSFFGTAKIKILILKHKTSLEGETPYKPVQDGQTDRNRALKQEALDHPLVKAIRDEFEDSSVEEIKVLS